MNQIKTKSTLLLACGLALVALPGAFAAHPGNHLPDAMFKAMDTNSDGKASRAEHAAAAQKMFTEADINHDGRVVVGETQAAHAKMQANHAKMNADMPMKADMQMKSDKPMKMEMSAA